MFPRHARVALCVVVLSTLVLGPPHARAAARTAARTAALVDTSAKLFKEMSWRSVGPANMGGRISDIAVVEKTPTTIYVATGTGGLFKTTNNGTTWSGVFDAQPVASIGAVA